MILKLVDKCYSLLNRIRAIMVLKNGLQSLFVDDNDYGYYCGLYDDLNYSTLYCKDKKLEYLKGKKYYDVSSLVIECESEQLIPIQPIIDYKTKDKESLIIWKDGVDYFRKKTSATGDRNEFRFDYIHLNKGDKITLNSPVPVVVGDAFEFYPKVKHKNTIVMLLLIDSLSQSVIEKYGFENVMPNTSRFFKNGIKFENNYCCCDWTLPGCATIFTGRSPIEHHIVHPRNEKEIDERDLFTFEIKADGYLTSLFNSNWRMDPVYGYIKNMDRSVYVYGENKGTFAELFENFVESMRTFPDRDHFVILSVYDLHHFMKEIQDIGCQSNESLEVLYYNDDFDGKSVQRGKDLIKELIYVEEIKKLDSQLNSLYLYLDTRFNIDEYAVVLAGDHGVSYVGEDADPIKTHGYNVPNGMSESMLKVPLMIKADGLEHHTVKKLSDNRCISRIVKELTIGKGLEKESVDNLFCEDYVINETIYPNQTYKVRLIDENRVFWYETEKVCDASCNIDNSKYKYVLVDKNTGSMLDDEDTIKKYLAIINRRVSRAVVV